MTLKCRKSEKYHRMIFEKMILPFLGAKDKSVLVGPQNGVDVGIAEIGGKAVSFTTDPVFIVPEVRLGKGRLVRHPHHRLGLGDQRTEAEVSVHRP